MESELVAVPTDGGGGLDSPCSSHFGHCDCITIVKIADGEIIGSTVRVTKSRDRNQCMGIIGDLRRREVKTILVSCMGAMSFRACNDLGIRVFELGEGLTAREAIGMYMKEELEPIALEDVIKNKLKRGCGKKK